MTFAAPDARELSTELLNDLAATLDGEFYADQTMRTLYATDASAYREMPLAVAVPKSVDDLKKLIAFARQHRASIIPRTAGTSLAGQVVGSGIVVDVSKYFTKILEFNAEEGWVRVQPGVVRDELNLFLKPHGLMFGPETSTANRAMIGGMVGNNSCGSNSVVYGSTREHLLEVKALLADGSEAHFTPNPLKGDFFITQSSRQESPLQGVGGKLRGELEKQIHQKTFTLLSPAETQAEIHRQFPKKSIERRNTGYALDELIDCDPFTPGGAPFNFCKLIAGSEGTLCFLTEIKLHLVPLPAREVGLLCVHFHTIDEALRANVIAMQHRPSASELIDHYILECTKENIEQRKNRFFVEGDPGAILVIEFRRDNREEVTVAAAALEADLRRAGFGYHFPLLFGEDTAKIWTLRKAGLGLLSNLPGDEKAVAVIEDTAVDVADLPAYIRDFNQILEKHGLHAVHYAHAGSGELHLRPIINLKTEEGNRQFRDIAEEIARLVKKYDGSLSGEHGDGRLRGEFIPLMVGPKNYELMREIKRIWDPQGIFNPGKIVDTPPMNTSLRYKPGQQTPEFNTHFRFADQDILQHAEQCNGSGDCRKTHLTGGTMCPSYMATRNEKDTTRARANILREYLTHSPPAPEGGVLVWDKKAPLGGLGAKEVKAVMDLCLSCKACKSECPSNVDVAKLKAEFLQSYHDVHGLPFRSWLTGNFGTVARVASFVPWAYNLIFGTPFLRRLANQVVGYHPDRSVPLLAGRTFSNWWKKRNLGGRRPESDRRVFLFADEFTNFLDVEIGKKAVYLLERLGYEVMVPDTHLESGRAYLSKGMLREGRKIANRNVTLLRELVTEETPLVGIEPSAILTFRDEYPDLVDEELLADTKILARNALTFEEFFAREIDAKRITKEQFTQEKRLIKLHGHCQQKAVSNLVPSKKMLSLPENYEVHLIPSGCCGMAGSFGYEVEHYDVSMKIGELVLFPAVRQQPEAVIIAAPGTSCRHQIHDGTGRTALHPIEILHEALR
ncbi:MAG: FAD-binding protein [Cytophagaceae bacterium]|nr:FAD-binding protein [Cytophagaceae bacterium]